MNRKKIRTHKEELTKTIKKTTTTTKPVVINKLDVKLNDHNTSVPYVLNNIFVIGA